jgi:hypothetical protein
LGYFQKQMRFGNYELKKLSEKVSIQAASNDDPSTTDNRFNGGAEAAVVPAQRYQPRRARSMPPAVVS